MVFRARLHKLHAKSCKHSSASISVLSSELVVLSSFECDEVGHELALALKRFNMIVLTPTLKPPLLANLDQSGSNRG